MPNIEFTDFVERLERHSGNYRIRTKLELIRNVQQVHCAPMRSEFVVTDIVVCCSQGLCELDDIEDYELAECGEHFTESGEVGMAGDHVGHGESLEDNLNDLGSKPVERMAMSDDQRERMERNKRIAMERAAAHKVIDGKAGTSVAPHSYISNEMDDAEMESAWAEEENGISMGPPDALGFDAFDEEAEDELFGNDVEGDQSLSPAGNLPHLRGSDARPNHSDDGPHHAGTVPQSDPEQRAREEAQAVAEALEAGLDDEL